MTSVPRAFQRATATAAEASLRGSGSRRFLIADEVGLGKTTVAREIVRRLSANGTKRLTVYYITGNTRVSDQNATRLVDFLSDEDKKKARSNVDRLSMIPLDVASDFPLRLYSLAPLTSFPPETTRPYTGAAVERAFLSLLIEAAVPGVLESLPVGFMQQRAVKSWNGARNTAKRLFGAGDRKLIMAYRNALRERFGYGLKRKIVEAVTSQSPSRALTVLRRLLAEACLEGRPPDLIIFDEFHGFRHLLAPAADDRLGKSLLGVGRKKPAMLLLSATPYRLYGDGSDGKSDSRFHEELFETIEFLAASKDVRTRAEELFASFGDILRAIGDADDDEFDPALAQRAREYRKEIEHLLRPYIARTERPPQTDAAAKTNQDPLPIELIDLRMFKHFASALERNRPAASAYWLSVPLPAQALASRYKIVSNISFKRDAGLPALHATRRKGAGGGGWGSPKLRALQGINSSSDLALPWVAPSLSWWPLAGPWEDRPTQKTLLFSRFRATPQSVGALMSLGVEDAYLDNNSGAHRRDWESKRLQPKAGVPVMALFHPSPFLIRKTDPLAGNHATAALALRTVTTQLRSALGKLKIKVRSKPKKDAERSRAAWSLLVGIERKSDDFSASQAGWQVASEGETVLGKIVDERHEFEEINWISARELKRLAELALFGPAIVVGRALRRHFADALSDEHLPTLTWSAGIGSGPILIIVYSGNVSDPANPPRSFWRQSGKVVWRASSTSISGMRSARPSRPDSLRSSARPPFVARLVHLQALPTSGPPIRLRCHAAVPFIGTETSDTESTERALAGEQEEQPARAEGHFGSATAAATSRACAGIKESLVVCSSMASSVTSTGLISFRPRTRDELVANGFLCRSHRCCPRSWMRPTGGARLSWSTATGTHSPPSR